MEIINSYGEFESWCIDHGYDADRQYDEKEEVYKRDIQATFYIKKESDGTFAQVTCTKSYDYGWSDIEIVEEGLARNVEQVLIEKVTYI